MGGVGEKSNESDLLVWKFRCVCAFAEIHTKVLIKWLSAKRAGASSRARVQITLIVINC